MLKKKIKTFNVAEKASEVFDKIYKDGWNGINVMDGEKECCWHEQYAIFILQFDTDFGSWFNDAEDNEYVRPARFDNYRFSKDFLKYLHKEFPGCKINVSVNDTEFEICGPKCSEFFDKHRDTLEDIEDTRPDGGHWVFQTPKRKNK